LFFGLQVTVHYHLVTPIVTFVLCLAFGFFTSARAQQASKRKNQKQDKELDTIEFFGLLLVPLI